MKKDKALLDLVGRLISSSVAEDKKTESARVLTVFEAMVKEGDLKNYDPDLEEVVFKSKCWKKLATEPTVGFWKMKLIDPKSSIPLAQLDECLLDSVNLRIDKEGHKVVSVGLAHAIGDQQKIIEAAVSTVVLVQLIPNNEILKGVGDETVELEEKDQKPAMEGTLPPA